MNFRVFCARVRVQPQMVASVAYRYRIKTPLYCLLAQALPPDVPGQGRYTLCGDVDIGFGLRSMLAWLSGVDHQPYLHCIENSYDARMSKGAQLS